MKRKILIGAAFAVVFVLGFCIGFLVLGDVSRNEDMPEDARTDGAVADPHDPVLVPHGHNHTHGMLEISESEQRIPRVDLLVREDKEGGWNLQIVTGNFRFVPEAVGRGHVPGEGHAHLYINGDKITRVYGGWFHVPAGWLSAGAHEFRVVLSTNDHREYAYAGEPIADSEVVFAAPR